MVSMPRITTSVFSRLRASLMKAEARAGADQLCSHQRHPAHAEADADAGEDLRQRRGQYHALEDLPLACAQAALLRTRFGSTFFTPESC